MAIIHAPEESAAEILNIYVHMFESRPGDVLRISNFMKVWFPRGFVVMEFLAGLEYAITQGWIEERPAIDAFKLTDTGFERAQP
ncbi:hypothetical protein ACHMW6_24630 [Pseudoduganella sp. UC29_106]|uniref:hypothetical protein n=1 Tax=Pseudoduganella sp. UC29_106 TaxID=3374553 RepID=UPI003756F2B4